MTVDELIQKVSERTDQLKDEFDSPVDYIKTLGVEAEDETELYGLAQPPVLVGLVAAEVLHGIGETPAEEPADE